MQQEIKYNTFSASPDDYLVPDGDLAAMAGLERKGGALWGELPRGEKFTLPTGATLMCIHKTANYTNYIYYQAGNESLYRLDENGNPPYDGGHIRTFAGVTIHKVEPIGNTLVVLASDGVHYILNKNGVYHYLGTHIPELDLAFELTDGKECESDAHEVNWETYPDVDNTPIDWITDGVEDSPVSATDHKEVLASLRQGIMASLNEAVADACNEKMFAFPFFVRYGFRMYDGSITMHSSPALLISTLNPPTLEMGWAISHDRQSVKAPAEIKAKLTAYKLHCKPLDIAQVDALNDWGDIVSSVDVFISPQFYTYNQGAKDREIILEAAPQPPRNTMLASQVCDNGTFYLLKQVRLSSTSQPLQQAGGYITPDFEPTNDNIVVRELMSDDYGTHDELLAGKSYSFNGRINLAGVSKKLFNGFPPACMWRKVGDTDTSTTAATVVVEADGREIIVRSPQGVVYYTNRADHKVWWFYYPHAGAKKAYLTIDGQNIELTLTAHPTLNGAYYCALDDDAAENTATYIPAPSTDGQRIVGQPNKVYTSEVNNPFYFPATGINTVGTGDILGICSAVRALSQGQFGQFPLYAFTTEGVWALQTTSEGGYAAVQPVTRDVCVDADSITQMDDAVLFVTARGIMIISGSQSHCISEVIDGRNGFSLDAMTEKANALKLIAGDPAAALEMDTFGHYRDGMRIMYDYRHQRIIVYNDTATEGEKKYPYAYVYSLEAQQWSVVVNDLAYHVNSYPDALAVTKNGEVVNMSEDNEPTGRIPFMLMTRPLDLGAPDIHKTVSVVIQRGVFDKSHVQQVLFGSTDLTHWHIVSSSKDAYLRGYSGTPYKWFRLMVMGALGRGESITGATVQYDTRLMNRPR